MGAEVSVPAFQPKKMHVELPGEEESKKEAAPKSDFDVAEDADVVASITEEIKGVSGMQAKDFQALDFEKDDDSNFHIDFIHATANLRARNYKIKECDRQKTKMIAGKIIPAIATTTAMITGAVSAEIYKFVQGKNKIEDFKNAFINLALPLFVFTEPDAPNKKVSKEMDLEIGGPVTAIPEGWTIWDKVEKQGPMTC